MTDHPSVKAAARRGDPFLPHSLRGDGSNVVPFKRRAAPPSQMRGGVPVGTAVQILEWVDDDPDLALKAWERERKADRPRITLISNLATVLKRHGRDVPVNTGATVTALPTQVVDAADVLSVPVIEVAEPVVAVDDGDDDDDPSFTDAEQATLQLDEDEGE